jgi:hypothetical protein
MTVVDLALGRLALHSAEKNLDEVVVVLDDGTGARVREPEPSMAFALIPTSLHAAQPKGLPLPA